MHHIEKLSQCRGRPCTDSDGFGGQHCPLTQLCLSKLNLQQAISEEAGLAYVVPIRRGLSGVFAKPLAIGPDGQLLIS